jgi:hypothetical protein
LPADLEARLEQIATTSGLEGAPWQALLRSYAPSGELERQRLADLQQRWWAEATLQQRLAQAAQAEPLLRPLLQVLRGRGEGLRRELDARLKAAGLEMLPVPPLEMLPERSPEGAAEAVLPQVLELLWGDPDPDTAGWALMVARETDTALAARLLQKPREGLGESPFLAAQRRGEVAAERPEFPAITACELFADLSPAGVLWIARQGTLRQLEPAAVLMRQGDRSDALAVVVKGTVQLVTSAGQPVELGPGQSVGEMGVITNRPRSTSVCAGAGGAELLMLPASAFEALLQRSSRFSRGLLVQLAERLARASTFWESQYGDRAG